MVPVYLILVPVTKSHRKILITKEKDNTMKYHVLLIEYNGRWYIEFGDYDRDVVLEEKSDSYADEKTKIITTTDVQKDIDSAVAKLNSK
tara:strand:+ start:281 stop:547 length:267 start_codon:yes stop_codon:yes gene_type:complete